VRAVDVHVADYRRFLLDTHESWRYRRNWIRSRISETGGRELMMKSTLKGLVLAVIFVFSGYGLAQAAPNGVRGVSTVRDAIGDSTYRAPYSTYPAPYMDITFAKVQQRNDGTLSFFMRLAGAIPDTPKDSSLIWVFHLDTDPNSSPGGLYVDYIARVVWNGSAFVGQLVHRFTKATGGVGTTITVVPSEIHGGTVRLTVAPALLGNPSSFAWNAATRPSTSVPYSDFAPDLKRGCLNCSLVTWTAK